MTAYMTGKDMLLLPDGATYHVGVKRGQVENRILTVGSPDRAQTIAKLLDTDFPTQNILSSRGFLTITGKYKGVGVSIIAIGMGAPMMDFLVREISFILPDKFAIVRFGTCGIFNKHVKPGTILTGGKGALYVYTNYAHYWGCVNDPTVTKVSKPFLISGATPCDPKLNNILVEKLKEQKLNCVDGLNACGETFYSCQGRKDENFNDANQDIVDTLLENKVDFVDMETHQLFHLGKLKPFPCAAAAIGIVQRTDSGTTENISHEQLHKLESDGGRACLETLIAFEL